MSSKPPVLDFLCNHSHYARRLLDAHVGYRESLLAGLETPFSRSEMDVALVKIGADLKSGLRKLRQQVWLRVATRDLTQRGDLNEVMATMTNLAEATIHVALQAVYEGLAERFGKPIGEESGQVQQLIVVGMGKLGGAELNVSSDVDLIFVYPEEGETDGARIISNHEFFNLLGKQLIAALAEPTDEGFVFRVDMRLRPFGDSGALTIGFSALESYFVTQGRPWERYAWIKARPLTGDRHNDLAAMVNPFVFRRYLDYGAIDQLRDLHRQIRADVARRDNTDNIKLGPGGIREIEFLAQVFQLIRGGREARLRSRSTAATLDGLVELKILSLEHRKSLGESYHFLRNLEHRLQYLDDAQTHSLPNNPDDRMRIARSLGKESFEDVMTELDRRRAIVSSQFGRIFASEKKSSSKIAQLVWQDLLVGSDAKAALEKFGYLDSEHMIERLRATRQSARYRQLPETSRTHFESIAPIVIELAGAHANPDETLTRSLDLLETVCRRETYLALLLEHRGALNRLLAMASSSAWAIRYLMQHPILLDELLDYRERIVEPDWLVLTQLLRGEIGLHRGDVERQWELLRHFKQAQMFNLIAQDIAGELAVERLSDHLSDLADCILDVVIESAWATIKSKHRDIPCFCVVGYGKLGSKELGYGSDLDMIFLYQDDHPAAAENYARLAQRVNSWLTTYTPSGVLYETDLRLRPDGASGLLVSSIAAFEQYQLHQAWLWEHQALTRARFCAGDSRVGAEFERIRGDVLCRPRDSQQLRDDVAAMREKMRQEQSTSIDEFDIKHGTGGLIDIEFMVQYLVLNFAAQHRELVANVGNIALLRHSAVLGLVDSDLGAKVGNAYRDLRRMQHRAWLDEQTDAQAESARVEPLVQPVRILWQCLFVGTA